MCSTALAWPCAARWTISSQRCAREATPPSDQHGSKVGARHEPQYLHPRSPEPLSSMAQIPPPSRERPSLPRYTGGCLHTANRPIPPQESHGRVSPNAEAWERSRLTVKKQVPPSTRTGRYRLAFLRFHAARLGFGPHANLALSPSGGARKTTDGK